LILKKGVQSHFAHYEKYHLESHNDDSTLVTKNDIERFFCDFAESLTHQGVSFVKVDNQASLDGGSTANLFPSYQRALVASFKNMALLYSMCHSPRIFARLSKATHVNIVRNSDDFFPNEPASHAWHIFSNATTAIITGYMKYSVPDWDMFQSHGDYAEYHAASRILSGGPVYISDEPGQTDMTTLRKLILQSGNATFLLRPLFPAIPAIKTMFSYSDGVKVYNWNRHNVVVGVFQSEVCMRNKISIASISPAKILHENVLRHAHCLQNQKSWMSTYLSFPSGPFCDMLAVDQFAVFSHLTQRGYLLHKTEELFFPLVDKSDFNIYTIVPLVGVESWGIKMACLGLLNKYNGGCVVVDVDVRQDTSSNSYLRFSLWAMGNIGFYVDGDQETARTRLKCKVNGEDRTFQLSSNIISLQIKEQLYTSPSKPFIISFFFA
jgi:hypothetical protein